MSRIRPRHKKVVLFNDRGIWEVTAEGADGRFTKVVSFGKMIIVSRRLHQAAMLLHVEDHLNSYVCVADLEITIGRSENNLIVLSDESVSRRHFRLPCLRIMIKPAQYPRKIKQRNMIICCDK